jgi:hypothetical protein
VENRSKPDASSVKSRLDQAKQEQLEAQAEKESRAESFQEQKKLKVWGAERKAMEKTLKSIKLVSHGVKLNGIELLQLISECAGSGRSAQVGVSRQRLKQGYFSPLISKIVDQALATLIQLDLLVEKKPKTKPETASLAQFTLSEKGTWFLENANLT